MFSGPHIAPVSEICPCTEENRNKTAPLLFCFFLFFLQKSVSGWKVSPATIGLGTVPPGKGKNSQQLHHYNLIWFICCKTRTGDSLLRPDHIVSNPNHCVYFLFRPFKEKKINCAVCGKHNRNWSGRASCCFCCVRSFGCWISLTAVKIAPFFLKKASEVFIVNTWNPRPAFVSAFERNIFVFSFLTQPHLNLHPRYKLGRVCANFFQIYG